MSFSFTVAVVVVVVVLSWRTKLVLVQLIQLHGSLTRSNREEPTSDQSHFRKKTCEGNTKHLKRKYAKRREQWNERYRSIPVFTNRRWHWHFIKTPSALDSTAHEHFWRLTNKVLHSFCLWNRGRPVIWMNRKQTYIKPDESYLIVYYGRLCRSCLDRQINPTFERNRRKTRRNYLSLSESCFLCSKDLFFFKKINK